MNARAVLCLIFVFVLGSTCYSQDMATVYRPLGANPASSFAQWDSLRQVIAAPTIEGRRPVLPGISGRDLELLQDAIARKYTNKIPGGSLSAARVELAKKSHNLPIFRGYMAEERFVYRNPEWLFVDKSNASQYDVYRRSPDGLRGQYYGQVKFHMNGNPVKYAGDMVKDWRAPDFIVPDDHVDQLRAYLKAKADKLLAAGDSIGATENYRNMNRVKGSGDTTTQVDRATQRGLTDARTARVTPYVFLGVATALLVAPTVWDWYQGEIDGVEAAKRMIPGGSAVFSGIVVDRALNKWKGGLLRGTLRGNAMVACVVLMVDTSWQVYEYGGISTALQSPEFVINLGGGISATGLALSGGYVGMVGGAKVGGTIGAFVGPEGVPIGAAIGGTVGVLIVGSAAGVAGYAGGAQGTRWALKTFRPELLYKQEEAYGQNLRKGIEDSITSLQTM